MQIDYTVPTAKTSADAIQAVVDAAQLHNFRVSFVHDVAKTLSERGFEREPLSIVEMCNAKFASEVLAEDVLIGLMLPCPVMVYEEDGDVLISTMRPTLMGTLFPDAEIADIAADVEERLFAIVEEAAGTAGVCPD
jgi:uncharacterized protein (DUF302 family)